MLQAAILFLLQKTDKQILEMSSFPLKSTGKNSTDATKQTNLHFYVQYLYPDQQVMSHTALPC